MPKLMAEDIKILNEGQQAKKIILDHYSGFEDFIVQNNLKLTPESVVSYTKRKKLVSEKFKGTLSKVFSMDYHDIILPPEKQIERYINNIEANIDEYKDDRDIVVFEEIKNICLSKGMDRQLTCTYWVMGLYHYNNKRRSIGLELMELAVSRAGQEYDLQMRYNLELGFIYFKDGAGLKAERYYTMSENALSACRISDISPNVLFRLYYRLGIHYNKSAKHDLGREKLEKSLQYASEPYEIGNAIMNIGLTYKRQGKYKKALEYYERALNAFDPEDNKNKSVIYNNMAEVYRNAEKYDLALDYVKKSFYCLGDIINRDRFITTHTYLQIQVSLNNHSKGIGKFLELLSMVDGYNEHKGFILEGIQTIYELCLKNNDTSNLRVLQTIIVDLIRKTEVEEYQKELKSFWFDINLFLGKEA